MSDHNDQDLELTHEDLVSEAESLAREVWNVSPAEALRRVHAGELSGTFFAARLSQIFFLLGDDFPESGGRLSAAPESRAHHAAAE